MGGESFYVKGIAFVYISILHFSIFKEKEKGKAEGGCGVWNARLNVLGIVKNSPQCIFFLVCICLMGSDRKLF